MTLLLVQFLLAALPNMLPDIVHLSSPISVPNDSVAIV
jgi:hypothetical protein